MSLKITEGVGPDRTKSVTRTIIEERECQVIEMLMPIARLNFIALTKMGGPSHPLRKRLSTRPREFNPALRLASLRALKPYQWKTHA